MRDKKKQLKANVRALIAANPNLPITGVVKEITGNTCTVILAGGLEITDVRLKATTDDGNYLLMIPKENTNVLMLSSDGSVDNLTVIKCDVVKQILLKENSLEIDIDTISQKIGIKNNQVDLKDVFADIVDALKTLKVFTPVGPSGIPLPTSITKINKIETDFKKILK